MSRYRDEQRVRVLRRQAAVRELIPQRLVGLWRHGRGGYEGEVARIGEIYCCVGLGAERRRRLLNEVAVERRFERGAIDRAHIVRCYPRPQFFSYRGFHNLHLHLKIPGANSSLARASRLQ